MVGVIVTAALLASCLAIGLVAFMVHKRWDGERRNSMSTSSKDSFHDSRTNFHRESECKITLRECEKAADRFGGLFCPHLVALLETLMHLHCISEIRLGSFSGQAYRNNIGEVNSRSD